MAIYTRYGTPFTLTSPVNWDTGWTHGKRQGDDVVKEYHLSDLKADGGLNEIQAASDLLAWSKADYPCRDCGQPLEVAKQEQRHAPPLTIVTCKNKDCALYSVTLSTDQYAALTDEQFQGYRTMVANLKKHLRGEG